MVAPHAGLQSCRGTVFISSCVRVCLQRWRPWLSCAAVPGALGACCVPHPTAVCADKPVLAFNTDVMYVLIVVQMLSSTAALPASPAGQAEAGEGSGQGGSSSARSSRGTPAAGGRGTGGQETNHTAQQVRAPTGLCSHVVCLFSAS